METIYGFLQGCTGGLDDADDTAVLAVYDPPKLDLPHIAVVIYPDGEVVGIAVFRGGSQDLVHELAIKVGADNDYA